MYFYIVSDSILQVILFSEGRAFFLRNSVKLHFDIYYALLDFKLIVIYILGKIYLIFVGLLAHSSRLWSLRSMQLLQQRLA